MVAPRRQGGGLPSQLAELRELVVTYAKQETVEPVKRLGRFVARGLLGSALTSIGAVLLALAGLRLLQSEAGGAFDGNWSWVPYLIVLAGCALVALLAVRSIGAPRRQARRREGRG